MHFSSAIVLVAATAAVAAPASVYESPIQDVYAAAPILDARAIACNNQTQLFRNPGFSGTAIEWSATGDSGVTGRTQTQYFPVDWPTFGGPSAYAIDFVIPKGQSKSFTLEQKITTGAGIRDGGRYLMGLNSWISGTPTVYCEQMWYTGYLTIFPTATTIGKPAGPPPSWFRNAKDVAVAGNLGTDPAGNQKAGWVFTCSADSTTDSKVTIYLDNASVVDTCNK